MPYKITNLGIWRPYTPDTVPEAAPPGAVFLKSENSGEDFYEFSRKAAEDFRLDTVFATAMPLDTGNAVLSVQRDIAMLFPGNLYLLKIEGVAENDEFPHRLFEQQNYNPEAGTITPFPIQPGRVITYKREMWARMTDAEADTLDADLNEQPARIRRQFADAQYIDHSDPLFAMMHGAIAGHFGEERAKEILAPSVA